VASGGKREYEGKIHYESKREHEIKRKERKGGGVNAKLQMQCRAEKRLAANGELEKST